MFFKPAIDYNVLRYADVAGSSGNVGAAPEQHGAVVRCKFAPSIVSGAISTAP
jgi:hypothetical protein